MKVYLNGNTYELSPNTGVQKTPVSEWPENIRLDGQQKRKDRSFLSSWAIDCWKNGLGIERQNIDLAEHDYRLWDVENCDTRFSSQIALSPAFITCTINPSNGNLSLILDYLGNVYFGEEDRQAAPIRVYQFSAPNTLGSNTQLDNTATYSRMRAIRAYGGDILFTALGGANLRQIVRTSGFNAVGTAVGSIPALANTIEKLGDIGGTAPVLCYGNNIVNFGILSQGLAAYTLVGSIRIDTPTRLADLESDGITLYAQLPDGIYNFDATPNKIIDTSRSIEKEGAITIHKQYLLFKNGYSLIDYDGSDLASVGYDREDGLPSDKWGKITAMASSDKFVFAAVQGLTYSHILTKNTNNAWQYYARMPSAGVWVNKLFLSNSPDGIDRLWCIPGSHATVWPGYFLNPLVNPIQAGTYSYVPTGHFTPPIYDGGLAEIQAGFFDNGIIADGVGGNNFITLFYGLNGASPVSTLGVVATTAQTHVYGSPYGLEGYRIQPSFMLSGANSGTSPLFRQSVIHYLKIPTERLKFDFTIDLELTQKTQIRPLEDIIGSLNYERTQRTLMPFWYGQMGTRNVRVLQAPALEEIDVQKIYEDERTGKVNISVMEVL